MLLDGAIERAPLPRPRLLAAVLAFATLLVALVVVAAVSPAAAVLSIPLLTLAAAAEANRETAVRAASLAGALVGVAALLLTAAVYPTAAAAAAPAAILAVAAWELRRPLARPVAAVSLGVGCVVVALVVASRPGLALLLALAAGAAASVAAASGAVSRMRAVALATPGRFVAATAAAVAVAVVFARWPLTTALVAVFAGGVVLAWRAPPLGLVAGVLLVGFEGTIKVLLGLDSGALAAHGRGFGAAGIDIVLFAAVAGVLLADRRRTPRSLWARATRAERAAIVLLGAWLGLSVLQIAQGGDLARGFAGFRLFQAYALVALAAAVVCARPELRRFAMRAALFAGLAVAGYAAFRVAVGPASAESRAALGIDTVTSYGGAVRAFGSFSSAVGLVSFLAPMAVFSLVVAYLVPRTRRLALAVGALSLVGLVGSYSRASIVGVVLGLVCALGLLVAASGVSRRRKLTSLALVLVTLGVTYGGVQIASQASPALRVRAQAFLHPLDDKSLQLRFDNWGKKLDAVGSEPLGHGIGAAGGASAPRRSGLVTTDNSFIKVLYDQGVVVAAIFFLGLLLTVVTIARRLRRARGEDRALGLASLAGFVTFLGISFTAEYVEQPGKVVAWALLGAAAAVALGTRVAPPAQRPLEASE